MRPSASFQLLLGGAVAGAMWLAACSSTGDAQQCLSYACDGSGSDTSSGGSSGAPKPPQTAEERRDVAKELFTGLYPALLSHCGGCHATTALMEAPQFMAGADAKAAHTTITNRTAYPQFLLSDVGSSLLLTKGMHLGPALDGYPDLLGQVIEWLRWEALALDVEKVPTTAAVALREGENSLSLDALGGPSGVALQFKMTKLGDFLRLVDARIAVSGDKPVQLVHPRLVVVHPDGSEWIDGSDTFGGVDTTFLPGEPTPLLPSASTYPGRGWSPWSSEYKIRVEVTKIAEGTAPGEGATGNDPCKDLDAFAAQVLPVLTGGGVAAGVARSCRDNSCHGSAQKSPDMAASYSNDELCKIIRGYLDYEAPEQSKILRPTVAGHRGGVVNNVAAYRQFWADLINNDNVF